MLLPELSAEEAELTGVTRFSPSAHPSLAGKLRFLTLTSFLLGVSIGREDYLPDFSGERK